MEYSYRLRNLRAGDPRLEGFGEALHHRFEEGFDRVAERAEIQTRDRAGDPCQHFVIARHAAMVHEPFEDALQPARALATRGTLSARLVREETYEVIRGVDEVGRVVEDDERARAEHRTGLRHAFVIVRPIEMLLEDARRRAATGLNRHERTSRAQAPRQVDDLAHRRSKRNLVVSGITHVARDRNDLVPFAALGADCGEPLRAALENRHEIGERLDVVDDRRHAIEPFDRREGRLETRFASLALE